MTIHYTMGGLKISPQAQVLDDADQIIPGLYAAGEAASGIHGINQMSEQMASMMHLYSARLREEKPLFAANCFSLFLSLSMQPCSEGLYRQDC